ncbi:YdcF family protein [Deinococcus yavapaiensis]|uniref:Uncharacterized SAM-binding protein YcdF (DUF218 family) n=1 Tax=Deinococcus yavapaiensis KR-236 TaxID=694435 RepID=A0A318S477_9DEIO|nr:YdcF family protein [Deinococcus yavapaiensis]PYE52870.1 uncharacterized SAM-binding protein YcdF (DUF218 family) [Deinococcus yavapaiensis KR-236]
MRSQGSAPGAVPLLVLLVLGAVLMLAGAASVDRPYPTLLVLGAAQYNGHPSPAFERRLRHALDLYRAGGVKRIVVSGGVGKGDRFSEGAVGVKFLRSQGVPERVLIAETRSRSTLENLRNSKPYLTGAVTLVTDEVHATRALALAKAVGLKANVSTVKLASTGKAAEAYRQRERMLLLAYTLLGVIDEER